MPVQPGHGNPYGDENVNPLTGERYPHLDEEPTPPATVPELTDEQLARERGNG